MKEYEVYEFKTGKVFDVFPSVEYASAVCMELNENKKSYDYGYGEKGSVESLIAKDLAQKLN